MKVCLPLIAFFLGVVGVVVRDNPLIGTSIVVVALLLSYYHGRLTEREK